MVEYWEVTATFPANAPAGSVVTATVKRSAVASAENGVYLPSGAVIDDIYVLSASGLKTKLIINSSGQSFPLNLIEDAIVVSNPSRPQTKLALGPGSYTFSMINMVAVGANNVPVTWYIKVL
jgi:hypothetical protein